MSKPLVSIGLPVYNGEKFLPRTLEQLLGQDYENFELIISNNCSTDNTEAICMEVAARDKRVRYYKNEKNIGATPNWNRVFQLAQGPYFKWAMHDDECDPTLVRRCMEVYATAPASTVLVYSRGDIIDENGHVKYPSPDALSNRSNWAFRRLARVLFRVHFAHPLWGVIKTEALKRARPAGCIEADLVLLADLSLQGQLVEIPDTLYRMRRFSGNATEIHKTEKALMAWYDPSKAGKRIMLPHWELVYLEYMRCIRQADISAADKLLCYAMVPSIGYWRRFLRWSGPFRHNLGLRRKPSQPVEIRAEKA